MGNPARGRGQEWSQHRYTKLMTSMGIPSGTEMTQSHKPTPTLERLTQVKARTGLSRSEIYRRIAMGEFPRPIKLSVRASAWSSAEIDAWIASRIAARDRAGQQ